MKIPVLLLSTYFFYESITGSLINLRLWIHTGTMRHCSRKRGASLLQNSSIYPTMNFYPLFLASRRSTGREDRYIKNLMTIIFGDKNLYTVFFFFFIFLIHRTGGISDWQRRAISRVTDRRLTPRYRMLQPQRDFILSPLSPRRLSTSLIHGRESFLNPVKGVYYPHFTHLKNCTRLGRSTGWSLGRQVRFRRSSLINYTSKEYRTRRRRTIITCGQYLFLFFRVAAGHSRKPAPPGLNEILLERYFHDGKSDEAPIDLAAQYIQQGRDHGIPSYTKWRQFCGLSDVTSFSDFLGTVSKEAIRRLDLVYRSATRFYPDEIINPMESTTDFDFLLLCWFFILFFFCIFSLQKRHRHWPRYRGVRWST